MTQQPYRTEQASAGNRAANRACQRCGEAEGHDAAYWGEHLCAPCAVAACAAYEAAGWWPHPPWLTDSRTDEPGPIAVLSADGWRQPGVSVWPWNRLAHPEHLAALMAWTGARQLWLHTSALERLGWSELPPAAEGWRMSEDRGDVNAPAWRNYWPADTGAAGYELCAPAWGDSPFSDCATGAELAAELERFAHYTGALWHRSGAITSERIVRDYYRRTGRGGRYGIHASAHPPPALPGPRGETPAGEEGRMAWRRRPAPSEARARWCYGFDLNGMFLAAAATLALPVGDVEHVQAPELVFDRRLPGYWLLDAPEWPFEGLLPAPVSRDRAGPLWVTTPTMTLLSEHSALEELAPHLRPLEAWIWPRHHQYLRPWYERLRDARTALQDQPGPALDAVKAVYQHGVGRLGQAARARGETDPLYQPYWRHAINAEARARMWARIARWPIRPVAVDVDCVWLLTSRGPESLAGELPITLGPGLGQWKHSYTLPGRDAREVLEAARGPRATFDALKVAPDV